MLQLYWLRGRPALPAHGIGSSKTNLKPTQLEPQAVSAHTGNHKPGMLGSVPEAPLLMALGQTEVLLVLVMAVNYRVRGKHTQAPFPLIVHSVSYIVRKVKRITRRTLKL